MDMTLSKKLRQCLSKIDRPLTFCTALVAPGMVPGLQIEGFGAVALPGDAHQTERLAAVGAPAPYGRGTQTIIDPEVRRVTAFSPQQVTIENPAWAEWLNGVVGDIRDRLGLGARTLSARLHQVLLYRSGDFFLSHQDGEKHDGMVATMTVVLPSHCQGGDVVVRHGGQEHRIQFADPRHAFDIQVAAWYADCEHEVEPLVGGSRLVLIYNLVLQRARTGLRAPDFGGEIGELSQLLGGWAQKAQTDSARCRLVIPLHHAYSHKGLKPDRLKGNDEAQAQALFAAAQAAGCRAYLVHLTYRELGEGLTDDRGYYHAVVKDSEVEMGEFLLPN